MNQMDGYMKQLQESLIEVEIEAENLLLARHQLVENDRVRNGNREALTPLRKRVRTTRTSVPSPFESIMKEIEGSASRPLVKEVCTTCGKHDSTEKTWMMFPGTDVFARIPFHAAHSVLDKAHLTRSGAPPGNRSDSTLEWAGSANPSTSNQEKLEVDAKVLQSCVKEKSFSISEKGALADKISPGVLRSLVNLTDKPK